MVDEMTAQVGGVGSGAVDERRVAAAQERHPHQVEAGARGYLPAVVADTLSTVEDRHVEPRQIGAKSGGPDNRLDGA